MAEDRAQPSVDLVVATVGRRLELERFLESVASQSYRNVRVIVVDQNDDDRLDPVLERLRGRLSILRLRSARGLSRARNVGLAQVAGDVVAFPDDDCWYPEDLLGNVVQMLEAHPEWSGLSVRALDARGRPSSMQWDRSAGPIGRYSIWRRAISFGIFLRSSAVEAVDGFAEDLGQGAGTPWGSGEESDFLLRILDAGFRIQYEPSLHVCHESPAPKLTEADRRKGYEYGLGQGHVLRLHGYPVWFAGYRVAQLLAGSALFVLKTRLGLAQFYFAMASGRAKGWSNEHETSAAATVQLPSGELQRTVGVLVEADGKSYRLDAPAGDYIGELVEASHRPYEHDLLRALDVFLEPGDVILDVGANIGNHTLYFAAHGSRVHAFEPNPEAVEYLRRNVVLNGFERTVSVYAVAVGDHPGSVEVLAGESEMRLGMARSFEGSGDVPLVRLDDVVAADDVALIKIDVEGAEASVVRGASSIIARSKPVIVVETETDEQRRALDSLLRTHHRFPMSFYRPPTHVYVPRRRDLLQLARQWRVLLEAAGRVKHRVHDRSA
jgi:FkbM family methyltransferase